MSILSPPQQKYKNKNPVEFLPNLYSLFFIIDLKNNHVKIY